MPDRDTRLAPYPDYRDSGLPWLGAIPAHWEVQRNGRMFGQRVEVGFPELPILEVSLRTGVRVRDMKNGARKQVMSDRAKYKRAVKGDIAYNMMRMWQGAVGVAPVDGLVSPAYVVARPFSDAESRYFSYLFRTSAYMGEVDGYSRGIVKDRNRLYWEDFKRMPSCVPPPDEQRQIVSFLDAHWQVVQRLFRNRRRLIEVLKEQKQAIIDRLLTQGVAPTVRRRNSGVDWLGDVPEHWDVLKLKRVARLDPPRSEALNMRNSSTLAVFLPMERISTNGSIDTSDRRPVRSVWQGFTYFRRDDVVLAKITPCFENGKSACLCDLPTPIGFGTTELIVMRANPRVTPTFLYMLTRLSAFRKLGIESMTGAAGQQRISPEFVANFRVSIPPTIAEQNDIVARIRSATHDLDEVMRRTLSEVDMIREYHARLVSDVVTGKSDVRKIAASQTKPALGTVEESDAIDEDMPVDNGATEDVEEVVDADD